MPNVNELALAFRAALVARDDAARQRILGAYFALYKRLIVRLNLLTYQIDEARQRGEIFSPSWLYQQDRYQALIAQLVKEMTVLSRGVASEIEGRQADELARGLRDSVTLMGAAVADAGTGASVGVSFKRLPVAALESLIGTLGDGSPLMARLGNLPEQAKEDVRKALVEGLATGSGPRAMAAAMRDALGGNATRALLIGRTEALRAYRTASLANMQANSDVVRGWRWVSARDRRTCFPAGTIVSGPRASNATSRYYSGELVVIRTTSGKELALTPNHPILTPNGWVAGALLKVGDQVIGGTNLERAIAGLDKNDSQIPSPIEKVFESFPMVSAEMPCAAPDFHGDGKGSDVYIVGANGLLPHDGNAPPFQPVSKLPLAWRDVGIGRVALSALGSVDRVLEGLDALLASVSIQVGALDNWALTGFENFGLSVGPPWYPHDSQASANGVSVDAVGIGQLLFGLAGKVPFRNFSVRQIHHLMATGSFGMRANSERLSFGSEQSPRFQLLQDDFAANVESGADLAGRLASQVGVDCILQAERKFFSGHVYNLETSEHWYSANGIIAHNCSVCWAMDGVIFPLTTPFGSHPGCRCGPAPIVKGLPPLQGTGEEAFARLPADQQREILGPAKFDAYRAGEIRLGDLVEYRDDPQWGPQRTEASLALARKQAAQP